MQNNFFYFLFSFVDRFLLRFETYLKNLFGSALDNMWCACASAQGINLACFKNDYPQIERLECFVRNIMIVFRGIQGLNKHRKIISNVGTPGPLRDDGLLNVGFRFF